MVVSKSHWSESEACLVGSYSLHCPLYGNGERLVVGHMPLSCILSSERQGDILSFRSCHELILCLCLGQHRNGQPCSATKSSEFPGGFGVVVPYKVGPFQLQVHGYNSTYRGEKPQLPTRPRPFIWVWTPFITIVGAHLVLKSLIFTRGLRPSQ